jgi:hypothetical protein
MFESPHHGEVQDLDTTPSQGLATGIQSSPGRINKGRLACLSLRRISTSMTHSPMRRLA